MILHSIRAKYRELGPVTFAVSLGVVGVHTVVMGIGLVMLAPLALLFIARSARR